MAHYWGTFSSVDSAVKAGKMANVPAMVDFGEHYPPNSIEDLFMKHLRLGDVFTHTFSSIGNNTRRGRESVVDDVTEIVKLFVFKAQKREIIFDVGHDRGAFSWSLSVPSYQ